jgi:hypothetical protein
MSAFPPWRQVLGPSGELHLVGLACGSDRLTARVTNLRGWWEGRLEASAIDEQRQQCNITSETAQVLAMVALCFAGKEAEMEYELLVESSSDARQPLILKWQMAYFSLAIPCEPIPDPAARLRDELTIPLLRGVQLLESMVPRVAKDAWLAKPADPRLLPLPDFRSPIVGRLLAPAPAAGGTALRDGIGVGGVGGPARPCCGESGGSGGYAVAAADAAPAPGAGIAAAVEAEAPPQTAAEEDARQPSKHSLKRARLAAETARR